jgi:hypothetical protein
MSSDSSAEYPAAFEIRGLLLLSRQNAGKFFHPTLIAPVAKFLNERLVALATFATSCRENQKRGETQWKWNP